MSNPVSWCVEWRIYPDRLQPPLKGKAKANAINRKFFLTKEQALAEQRLQRAAHAGNVNFVSCVVPWEPPPAKPPRKQKPGQKK